MTRQPIASSMLKSLGYDEVTLTLEAEFKGGELWQYSPVGPEVFASLIEPGVSVGRVFHAAVLRNPDVSALKVEPWNVDVKISVESNGVALGQDGLTELAHRTAETVGDLLP
jgi:hypothetical protein